MIICTISQVTWNNTAGHLSQHSRPSPALTVDMQNPGLPASACTAHSLRGTVHSMDKKHQARQTCHWPVGTGPPCPWKRASVCKSGDTARFQVTGWAQGCLAMEEGLLYADAPRCGHSPHPMPRPRSLGSVCRHILGAPGLYTMSPVFSTCNFLSRAPRPQVRSERFQPLCTARRAPAARPAGTADQPGGAEQEGMASGGGWASLPAPTPLRVTGAPWDEGQARAAQHPPYTSLEFCCFSSRTMSTTMARKDLSLV